MSQRLVRIPTTTPAAQYFTGLRHLAAGRGRLAKSKEGNHRSGAENESDHVVHRVLRLCAFMRSSRRPMRSLSVFIGAFGQYAMRAVSQATPPGLIWNEIQHPFAPVAKLTVPVSFSKVPCVNVTANAVAVT